MTVLPNHCEATLANGVISKTAEKQSFSDLPQWIQDFRATVGSKPLIFIVGNKADLEDQIQVEQNEISAFAEKGGYIFFTTSAVSGLNVDFLFQTVAEQIVKSSQGPTMIETSTKLTPTEETSKSCC